MRTLLGALVLIAGLSLIPAASQADGRHERPVDAGLGALSGAVVFGPVGLVAGAVVGYTAGPGIARSWGLKRHHHHIRRPVGTAAR